MHSFGWWFEAEPVIQELEMVGTDEITDTAAIPRSINGLLTNVQRSAALMQTPNRYTVCG